MKLQGKEGQEDVASIIGSNNFITRGELLLSSNRLLLKIPKQLGNKTLQMGFTSS